MIKAQAGYGTFECMTEATRAWCGCGLRVQML